MSASFPVEPLLAYVAARWPDAGTEDGRAEIGRAELLGVHPQAWCRILRKGSLSTLQADEIGVHVAGHPALIWPSWYEAAEEEDRCGWCRAWLPLDAYRRNQMFCTPLHSRYLKREQQADRERLEAAEARGRATYERLMAMSDEERAEWLGESPGRPQRVEEAA